MELVPALLLITGSTLPVRVSTRCWNISAGTCFHSARRALVRPGTDVWRVVLARSWRSNSSQRRLMGLRSGLWRPVTFFHTNLNKPFLSGPRFVHGDIFMQKQEQGPSPNCCHNVGSTESSRMSLYAVALTFPFHEGQTMKNSPRPLFLTLQLGLYIGAGRVLLASAKPRFVRRSARC